MLKDIKSLFGISEHSIVNLASILAISFWASFLFFCFINSFLSSNRVIYEYLYHTTCLNVFPFICQTKILIAFDNTDFSPEDSSALFKYAIYIFSNSSLILVRIERSYLLNSSTLINEFFLTIFSNINSIELSKLFSSNLSNCFWVKLYSSDKVPFFIDSLKSLTLSSSSLFSTSSNDTSFNFIFVFIILLNLLLLASFTTTIP